MHTPFFVSLLNFSCEIAGYDSAQTCPLVAIAAKTSHVRKVAKAADDVNNVGYVADASFKPHPPHPQLRPLSPITQFLNQRTLRSAGEIPRHPPGQRGENLPRVLLHADWSWRQTAQ